MHCTLFCIHTLPSFGLSLNITDDDDALQDELLVEYDMATTAPIGLVTRVPDGCSLQLLAAGGAAPQPLHDGADIAAIRVVAADGACARVRVCVGGGCKAVAGLRLHCRLSDCAHARTLVGRDRQCVYGRGFGCSKPPRPALRPGPPTHGPVCPRPSLPVNPCAAAVQRQQTVPRKRAGYSGGSLYMWSAATAGTICMKPTATYGFITPFPRPHAAAAQGACARRCPATAPAASTRSSSPTSGGSRSKRQRPRRRLLQRRLPVPRSWLFEGRTGACGLARCRGCVQRVSQREKSRHASRLRAIVCL